MTLYIPTWVVWLVFVAFWWVVLGVVVIAPMGVNFVIRRRRDGKRWDDPSSTEWIFMVVAWPWTLVQIASIVVENQVDRMHRARKRKEPEQASTECPSCGHDEHSGWCTVPGHSEALGLFECGCLDDRVKT